MEALLIYKNNVRLVSAELQVAAVTAFDLDWIANPRMEIGIALTRVDGRGTHTWKVEPIRVGENVSFITAEVNEVDEPNEFLTNAEMEILQRYKPTIEPGKRARGEARDVGELICHINQKQVCSVRLNTDNLFLANFAWLEDKNGYPMMHMGLGGSSPALEVPKMKFGDEVTFTSVSASCSPGERCQDPFR